MSVAFSTFLILALSLPLTLATDQNGIYRIGVGISDITGPPAGVVLVKFHKINRIKFPNGI